MKTYSSRFEAAISKLYQAFHQGNLNPECCNQCAVGNLLDNKDYWKHFAKYHGSTTLTYVGHVNEAFGKRFNGYSPSELLSIEKAFLSGCGYVLPINGRNSKPKDPMNKDLQFHGLIAVISKLCELENIEDVMDCEAIFSYQPQALAIA
ncbi:Na(+)-translocating NADH-quinone reductase subunit F [Aureitalea marina]|uniref:Na(+)-translocating NADH-quinone reductase subunit F n=1 Tax=Aureitalea marina TaxID=930804 RepID=A0A2S7KLM6_9FLAO|nr:Na(+)-translocating NADH-quinone reductase subunit F [Aureitalea marina]PQB03535.1 Na(+)-translocating NADH-quinone reductase subunit F [Aureitalea marina]